jgi:hypothetical protein
MNPSFGHMKIPISYKPNWQPHATPFVPSQTNTLCDYIIEGRNLLKHVTGFCFTKIPY